MTTATADLFRSDKEKGYYSGNADGYNVEIVVLEATPGERMYCLLASPGHEHEGASFLCADDAPIMRANMQLIDDVANYLHWCWFQYVGTGRYVLNYMKSRRAEAPGELGEIENVTICGYATAEEAWQSGVKRVQEEIKHIIDMMNDEDDGA